MIRRLSTLCTSGWDLLLALLPVMPVLLWPEHFPVACAMVGVPLLLCRAELIRLNRQLL